MNSTVLHLHVRNWCIHSILTPIVVVSRYTGDMTITCCQYSDYFQNTFLVHILTMKCIHNRFIETVPGGMTCDVQSLWEFFEHQGIYISAKTNSHFKHVRPLYQLHNCCIAHNVPYVQFKDIW